MFKMVYDGLRQLLMLFDAKDPMLSCQFSNQPIEEVNWGLPSLLLQCPSTRRLWFWNFLSWGFPAFAPKPAGNCHLALTHIHIIYIIISLNYIYMYIIYIYTYGYMIHVSILVIYIYIYIYLFIYIHGRWTFMYYLTIGPLTISFHVKLKAFFPKEFWISSFWVLGCLFFVALGNKRNSTILAIPEDCFYFTEMHFGQNKSKLTLLFCYVLFKLHNSKNTSTRLFQTHTRSLEVSFVHVFSLCFC